MLLVTILVRVGPDFTRPAWEYWAMGSLFLFVFGYIGLCCTRFGRRDLQSRWVMPEPEATQSDSEGYEAQDHNETAAEASKIRAKYFSEAEKRQIEAEARHFSVKRIRH